jgi:folate-binding Fe-S cluster repair protein YgfZ
MTVIDVAGPQAKAWLQRLLANDVDHGHVGYIEHTAITTHLMVLFDLRAIVQGHIPTAKIDHLRAEGEMKVIQRRTLSHGFLLPGLAKVRTGTAQHEHLKRRVF